MQRKENQPWTRILSSRNTIIIGFCLLVINTGLSYGQTLSVPSVSGFPGDVVLAHVDLNDGSGVGGVQFNLSYDSAVLSILIPTATET